MLMNDDNAILGHLSHDTRIWRYMSLPKFIAMLDKGGLWLPRLLDLGDPFEGVVSPFPVLKYIQSRLPPDNQIDFDKFSSAIETHSKANIFDSMMTYVTCWNIGDEESDFLWRIYGNDGIAIQTTAGKLIAAAKGDDKHSYMDGKITYVDELEGVDDPYIDGVFIAFRKRSFFQYEQEYRLACREEWNEGDGPPEPGILLPINVEEFIERLIVSPNQPEWFLEVVRAVMRQFGYNNISIEMSKMKKPLLTRLGVPSGRR